MEDLQKEKLLHVGTLTCKTAEITSKDKPLENTFIALGIEKRLEILGKALEAFVMDKKKQEYSNYDSWLGEKCAGIFVAPEYMFAREYAGSYKVENEWEVIEYGLGEEEKDFILEELMSLSKEFPKILIIPGTIAWQHKYNNEMFKQIEELNERIKKAGNNDEIWTAAYDAGGESAVKKIGYIKNFKLDTTGKKYFELKIKKLKQKDLKVARNNLYVILNGEIVHVYDKVADATEVKNQEDLVFIPGNLSNRKEKILGKDFIFEICADHSLMEKIETENDSKGDIHILVSAGLTGSAKVVGRLLNQKISEKVSIHADSASKDTETLIEGMVKQNGYKINLQEPLVELRSYSLMLN